MKDYAIIATYEGDERSVVYEAGIENAKERARDLVLHYGAICATIAEVCAFVDEIETITI